jgi:hypothetical protein
MAKTTLRYLLAAIAGAGLMAVAAGGARAGTTDYTRIPGLDQLLPPLTQQVDWRIYRKYYNGCYRWRWCSARYWNGYKWVYSHCYWGDCGGYSSGY